MHWRAKTTVVSQHKGCKTTRAVLGQVSFLSLLNGLEIKSHVQPIRNYLLSTRTDGKYVLLEKPTISTARLYKTVSYTHCMNVVMHSLSYTFEQHIFKHNRGKSTNLLPWSCIDLVVVSCKDSTGLHITLLNCSANITFSVRLVE